MYFLCSEVKVRCTFFLMYKVLFQYYITHTSHNTLSLLFVALDFLILQVYQSLDRVCRQTQEICSEAAKELVRRSKTGENSREATIDN